MDSLQGSKKRRGEIRFISAGDENVSQVASDASSAEGASPLGNLQPTSLLAASFAAALRDKQQLPSVTSSPRGAAVRLLSTTAGERLFVDIPQAAANPLFAAADATGGGDGDANSGDGGRCNKNNNNTSSNNVNNNGGHGEETSLTLSSMAVDSTPAMQFASDLPPQRPHPAARRPMYYTRQQQRQSRRNRHRRPNAGEKGSAAEKAWRTTTTTTTTTPFMQGRGGGSTLSVSSLASEMSTPTTLSRHNSMSNRRISGSSERDGGFSVSQVGVLYTGSNYGGNRSLNASPSKNISAVNAAPTAAALESAGAGLLPVTALFLAATSKEAGSSSADKLLKGLGTLKDGRGRSAGGETSQEEQDNLAMKEKEKADALLRLQTGGAGADGGGVSSQDAFSGNYYVRKRMQNVAQAKESQKQMREFEDVLRYIEEEALRVRRKVRQRATTRRTATGAGDVSFANAGSGDGEGTGNFSREDSPDADDLYDDQDELDLDDGFDFDGDEQDEQDDQDDEDAVGFLCIDDGSGAAGQRYTPLARRLQLLQQQSGNDSSNNNNGDGGLTAVQEQRLLRRQLMAAERFLRDHPEMESTLRKEIVASESRLSAVRTVRALDTKALTNHSATATATAGPLPSLIGDGGVSGTATEEQLDWVGYVPTGIKRADADKAADETLSPDGQPLLPTEAATDSAPSSATSTRTDPSPAVEVTMKSSRGSTDSLSRLLSESLLPLSYEDKLAELLERGNGRAAYGTEVPRSPQCSVRRHSARSGPDDLPTERKRSSGAVSPTPAVAAVATAASPRKSSSVARLSTTASLRLETTEDEGNDAGRSAAAGGGVSPTPAGSPSSKEKTEARRVTFLAQQNTPKKTVSERKGAASAQNADLAAPSGGTTTSTTSTSTKRKKTMTLSGKQPAADQAKKREILPVVIGVGDRAAMELRKRLMRTRLEEMEAQMTTSKDTRRSCELLARLQPMREALIHRDIIDVYGASDPSEWEKKYPKRSEGAGGAMVSLPQITHTRVAEANRGAIDKPAQSQAKGDATLTSGTVVASVTSGDGNAAGESRGEKDRRLFANAAETLERHRTQIFAKAFELDDKHRKKSRLLFVDVLESMCRKQIPPATWPAAQAALNHARHILLDGPREHQSFIGFQAIVHKHFTLLQLIQWPVQQMLERLSALFLMTTSEYREWLANLYQKLCNSHDYEERFRAIDRTVTGKDIPAEAHVRIILHACRKLPRALLLSSQSHNPNQVGKAGGGDAGTAGAALTGKRASVLSQKQPPALPPNTSRQSSPGKSRFAGSATCLSLSTTRRQPSSATQGPPRIPSSTARLPLVVDTTRDGDDKREECSGKEAQGGLADTGGRQRGAAASTVVDPFTPSATNLFAMRVTPVAATSGEPEYAIRIEAERQTITSSAMPAITSGSGSGSSSGGARGTGLFGAASSARHRGGGVKDKNGTLPSDSAANPASGKSVSFCNQTFKLHLYDASSPIRLLLLRDGQTIAEGTFSVQRYGNGKKIQLWLPLALTKTAKGSNGGSGGNDQRQGSKKTELKMTVEVM